MGISDMPPQNKLKLKVFETLVIGKFEFSRKRAFQWYITH